ncbi:MAG: Mu-like prophage major head subunit gpT family protein, partial [Acidithiobacillus sp.]|uniref:Mu-like prophage major head subunit gpT family protein n=1 Tax=Acidithiobacillus sp. TaxID=1872118 RepID=UPI00258E4AA9
DDNVGVYTPLFAEMGRAAAAHPDELAFGLLAAGESTLCYDGQNFFDTDHPVYPNVDGTGTAATVSNLQAGTGPAWYLLDNSRALKPLIFQERTAPELQAMTQAQDEAVFMRDEYRYGIRYRCNAGFGFWQLAYKSKATLDAANFNAAMAAMMATRADGGRPMGIKPTHLVVPPSLRADALTLIKALMINNTSNPNYEAVEVIVSPWLQ